MLYIILFLIVCIYISPHFDIFMDYRGEEHLIIWYNDIKRNRKYIQVY